jgi:hypothetical protein
MIAGLGAALLRQLEFLARLRHLAKAATGQRDPMPFRAKFHTAPEAPFRQTV